MSVLSHEQLSDETLRRYAGSGIFYRGQAYYRQNRVSLSSLTGTAAHLHVIGTRQYCVDIAQEGAEIYFDCNCPYSMSGYVCKHIVAGGIFLREHLRIHGKSFWKSKLSRGLEAIKTAVKQTVSKPYLLFFSLQNYYGTWNLKPYRLPVAKLMDGIWDPEQPEAQDALHDVLEHNAWLSQQATEVKSALKANACVNSSPDAVSVANLMIRANRVPEYYYYSYTLPLAEYLPLLSQAGASVFYGVEGQPLSKKIRLFETAGQLQVEVQQTEEGLLLDSQINVGGELLKLSKGETTYISKQPPWILADRYLFELSSTVPLELASVFLDDPEYVIPEEGETEFLENFFIPLAEHIPLTGNEIEWEDVEAEPVKRLYLTEKDGDLLTHLRFGYEAYEAPYDKTMPISSIQRKDDNSWTLLRIQRDPVKEEEIYRSISSARSGLKYSAYPHEPGTFLLRARVDPIDFLLRKVPNLMADGFEIYGEEALKTARVNRNTPTVSLNVTSGIDWFDVQALVKFGDVDVSLQEVRRALRKKNRFVKLGDGTIGEIPEEWVKKYRHLFGLGEQTDDGVRFSNHHLTMIDQLLGEADRVVSDAEYGKRLQRLKNFEGIDEQILPNGFNGTLRPYQKAGFDWLHFLHEYEFGGCLADDMGLGKTVQVLVFLKSLRENDHAEAADLVIVPRSLLINWEREAEHFTPGVRVYQHFGPGREKENPPFDQYDIVLTTYGTMRRDIQLLRNYKFHYVVLDESQAIKNPTAQTSKAARLLNSHHRMVMTGTPVENNTFELWSQFAFLNPGLLGNLEYFKKEFSGPIERQNDEDSANFLRKMVYPFILRRTKAQVAPELPPRTDRIMYSDMEPAQRKFYNRTRDYYRSLLMGMLEEQGMNNTRMKILEGLLRLRQISNHPQLVDEKFRGKSAKMEMLVEHLETLHKEGHKALIFSQFVKMLKLVETEMKQRKIPYTYLDGRTRKRQERVDQFQSDPNIPFFLISLRAGGVGLNLTAADYVIHIDPWWNPAVEMQATDRTHRIGQDKPVFVYKLIARDTVEEKIVELQERKKKLVEQLITTESSFFKNISTEDVKVLFS